MSRKLWISTYKSRFDKNKKLKVRQVTWEQMVKRLGDIKITDETFEDYQEMESLDRLAIKDVGYFVGGKFDPPQRKTFNLKTRSILTLDLDHIPSWELDEIRETYGEYAYVVHSSHSHSEDDPRLRLVMPLARDVTPEEYEPLARRVASMLDMDFFDDTTYQFSRIMFWPSRSKDADYWVECNTDENASFIDPDEVLGLYEDWKDWGSWPTSSRENKVRASVAKAQDPFTKPGIIGAFNRAYPIPEAIEAFELPYVESGQGDGRYTYTLGTSADGAVYYPDDGHLFSHHDSDPAKGNQNAWDLVRIHRFGELDDGLPEDTPSMQRPSSKEMQILAGGDQSVVREMADAEGFEDLGPEEVETEDISTGKKRKLKRSELSFESIKQSILEESADTGKLSDKALRSIILRIAAAGAEIDSAQRDVLALNIKEAYPHDGATKASIVTDIKAMSKRLMARGSDDKDELKDIQVEFIRNFLDRWYQGGETLRRTGRQFWAFKNTHWVPVDDEVIAGQLVKSLVQLRVDPAARKESKALAAAVGENTTSAIHSALWNMFKSWRAADIGVQEDAMGLLRQFLPTAINCTNGTIDFRPDGKHRLRPHNPDDLYTSVVYVDYEKEAECPEWDRFCSMAFKHSPDPQDTQRHLEELMGYILNQSRKLRAWVLFYGPTGSGKSTVGKVLNAMLRHSAKNITMHNYAGSNSHATAGLIGKQLLLDDDYPEGLLLNDGFLKAISEEKPMDANPKGRDEFQFIARVVPVILSNYPPATKDTTGALYDRALVFPFDHSIPRKDRDEDRMRAMITDELPGIFRRCVRGLGRLVSRGDWAFPAQCSAAWESWIHESNPLPMFVAECVEEDEDAMLKTADAWEAYKSWWIDETGDAFHSSRLAMRKNIFYRKMDQALKTPRTRTTGGTHFLWKGWRLRPGLLDEDLQDDWDQ